MTDSSMLKADRVCDDCGQPEHIFQHFCIYDLHGEGDSFKTSCAYCETTIPSGGDRVGDQYGNLYCGHECKSKGLEIIIHRVTESDHVTDSTEAVA